MMRISGQGRSVWGTYTYIFAAETAETGEVVHSCAVDACLLRDRERGLGGHAGRHGTLTDPSVIQTTGTSRRDRLAVDLGDVGSVATQCNNDGAGARKRNATVIDANMIVRLVYPNQIS